MGGRGHGHVEHGLDRAALLDEVDRLQWLNHALAEAGGEKLVEIVAQSLLARLFDRLDDRLRAAVAVLGEDGNDLVEPAIGSALGVADADLGMRALPKPHDLPSTGADGGRY